MKAIFAVVVSVLAALSLSGCGSDTTTTPAPAAGCTPTTCNIVQKAQETPSLSTLVSSLISANLTDTLSGPGPFTVFAPTNAAFDAISAALPGLPYKNIVNILTYHVVAGEAFAKDLVDGEVLSTLFTSPHRTPGNVYHSLTVDLSKGGVTITTETADVDLGSAQVTTADIVCSNGVVHIIDAVLIPKDVGTGTMGIVETLLAIPSLSYLVSSAVTANLVETLDGAGTVFAPTNRAFDAISSVIDAFNPSEALINVLTYHAINLDKAIADSIFKAEDLVDGRVLPTLFTTHSLTVDLSKGGVTITTETGGSAQVTIADIVCQTGVVHIVDAVMIPNNLPSAPAITV